MYMQKYVIVFISTEPKACFRFVCYFFKFLIFSPFYLLKAYCFSMTFHDLYYNSMTFEAWKLRWLETVSNTFQGLEFDGSL